MKKQVVSWIALMLVVILALAACGKGENGSGDNASGTASETAEKTDAAPAAENTGSDEGTAAGTSAVDWDDMAEIEFYTFAHVAPTDVQHIEDAINAITEEKINTHVHMTALDIGSYIPQIGIMMAGQERIDLMLSGFATASYSSMLAQHQLMDISEYIDMYGADIKAVCGDLLKACSLDGGIYATPCYRNINASMHISMRKDVLEDLGLLEKAETMTSVDEYIEILEAVKSSEKWSYLRGMQIANGAGLIQANYTLANAFADLDAYDQLGDQIGVVEVDDNGKVQLVQATEAYANAAAKLREMNDKGLLYLDLAAESVSCEDLIKDDILFSFSSVAEFGMEETLPSKSGRELVVRAIGSAPISTTTVTKFCFEVPVTAEEPAAAVAFLNLCYTSPELNNLLAWGEEGVDYEVVDGVARYIEGNESPSFHMEVYSVPNGFLVTPWDGQDADYNVRAKADMDACELSKYMGFVADLDNISTEIASVSTVLNEYELQIKSGQASEAVYQEYLDKLASVGVDKIIQTYQEQLDAWLAEQ